MKQESHTPETAKVFEFLTRSFDAYNGEFTFTYRIHFSDATPMDFKEIIRLSDDVSATPLPPQFLNALLEDLHLVLGISYYKLFCPPTFKTDIRLSKKQTLFWNTLYTKGLSEFLYRNTIDHARIAQFTATESYERDVSEIITDPRKVLIGIGGGKDSIVSLELLKEYERTGFILETGKEYTVAREVCEVGEIPFRTITRTLDPQLYAGVEGSYGGHLPISSIYAFLGILEAALQKHAFVVVSNEYSSSFGSITEHGTEVNHQWSKSIEFEELFQDYVRTHITRSIRYFSLLRPFYELRIVEMFTEMGKKYFEVFSSCNRNFSHLHDGERWCGKCAKCAFAFVMFTAFLPKDEVLNIFKKNLFDDAELIPMFKDLLGFGTMKPFDCVGTFDESRVAFARSEKAWGSSLAWQELGRLLQGVTLSDEVLKVQQAKSVPSRFRLLGMKSALILGYEKEGKATELFLQNKYKHLRIGVSDQKDGSQYLDAQHAYDITIKTPGMPGRLVTRQYTTATNIFFSLVAHEQIIGVTGSKGKSTTATLIYEMLHAEGLDAQLVGNIGISALESIREVASIKPEQIFVFELSSYQLADMDDSPHIAVVTSLFPEHLDYHGSLEAYFNAKSTIIRYQNENDIFVHAEGFPELTEWESRFSRNGITPHELPKEIANDSLRGKHMHSNATLAYTVAKLFKVKDENVMSVLDSFKGLPHRLMHVGTYHEIQFYDDSISTTPESTIEGIKALTNVDTIILGGVDRGYDFSHLENELCEKGIRNVILFPQSGEHMLTDESAFTVLHTSSMDEAVQFAYTHTEKGKSCLLSPAAPSYNLFTNFEERGNAFIAAVEKYK